MFLRKRSAGMMSVESKIGSVRSSQGSFAQEKREDPKRQRVICTAQMKSAMMTKAGFLERLDQSFCRLVRTLKRFATPRKTKREKNAVRKGSGSFV